MHINTIWSSKFLYCGTTYDICCTVAETISVTCSKHSTCMMHQVNILYVCNIGGQCAKSYCGTTHNTSVNLCGK